MSCDRVCHMLLFSQTQPFIVYAATYMLHTVAFLLMLSSTMTQNSGADISTILAAFLVRLSLQDATIFLILFLNVRSSIITNNTIGSNITNKVTPTSKFVSELSRTGIATTEISNI